MRQKILPQNFDIAPFQNIFTACAWLFNSRTAAALHLKSLIPPLSAIKTAALLFFEIYRYENNNIMFYFTTPNYNCQLSVTLKKQAIYLPADKITYSLLQQQAFLQFFDYFI